jgi:nitrogenase molybdenum-cofactor synthesis protein NifE
VKSWSVISALKEVGMEIIKTSVRKSTPEDKERVKELMQSDAHMVDAIPAREMYAQLASSHADILLSGGRTQFIALKARTPWLDINQERHHAYAGYDGIVTLVEQLDNEINNPVWKDVKRPAPWDGEEPMTAVAGVSAEAVQQTQTEPSAPASKKLQVAKAAQTISNEHGAAE